MGGLAAAAALGASASTSPSTSRRRKFARLGAGIQIGCNAMQVLRGLGLERGFADDRSIRVPGTTADWRTGEVSST